MSKLVYFGNNTHQASSASTNRYPSFWDNDGDVVYILPFFASSIPALVGFSHTNEDLREFLHCELGSGQGVFTLSGQIFWGADIHDHL